MGGGGTVESRNVEADAAPGDLKYLEFVHQAAVLAMVRFLGLYGYAKDNSGPLKSGVETVEETVKTVVGPVVDKYHNVPIELLKFVDRRVIIISFHPILFSVNFFGLLYVTYLGSSASCHRELIM